MTNSRLIRTDFGNIAGWEADDHALAMQGFLSSANHMLAKPYKTRGLGVDANDLRAVAKDAVATFGGRDIDGQKARAFFEARFAPHVVKNETAGFLTGYYEPVVCASRVRSTSFPVPLYRRPPNLIDIDKTNRPATMDPAMRFGRHMPGGIAEYYDRRAVMGGALDGQGLELAFLKDEVSAFFVHVQGAARLQFDDGDFMRVTYAAKTGHPYTSLGKVLCDMTDVRPEYMTADRLAHWMHSNPERCDDLLWHNRSYIFFEEVTGLGDSDGPIAAAKVPLITRRSLAVDRTLHTFGAPIWLSTSRPLPGDQHSLARLMIAHDTGSAIVGAARGDIFLGTGDQAGFVAGRVRHECSMTVLVPGA